MNSVSSFSSFPKSETEYFIFGAFAIAFSWRRFVVSSCGRIADSLHSHSTPFLTNGFGDISGFRVFLRVVVGRFGLNLARRLVLREGELFLDLTLPTGELLIALLVLEGSANLGLQFLAALVGIRNVAFQFG